MRQPQPLSIRPLSIVETNALYKAANYSGRAAPNDLMVGVCNQDQVITAARIVNYQTSLLLRNLCTLPNERHKGYAKNLLARLHGQCSKTLYVFPLPELVRLYQKSGYHIINESKLPPELILIWQQVSKKYPTTAPMVANKIMQEL